MHGPRTCIIGVLAGLATALVAAVPGSAVEPQGAPTITARPPALGNAPGATIAFTGAEGAELRCALDGADYAPCTSPVTLTDLADGSHTFSVEQRSEGQEAFSDPSTASWVVDTGAPATPTLTGTPAPNSDETDAEFAFVGESGAGFACAIDSAAYGSCTSPDDLTNVPVGTHTFAVRQTDAAGNAGAPTTWSWTVVAPPAEPTAVNEELDSSIFVRGTGVTVGCSVDVGSLALCSVWANLAGFHARTAGTHHSATGVLGHGSIALNQRGIRHASVRIAFDRAGRVLLAHHLRGIRVRFDVAAQPYDDIVLRNTRIAVVRASHIRVVPNFPQFAGGSAKVTGRLRRYLATVARLASPVKSIACIGYTASLGGARGDAYRRHLGLQRARAVCAVLRSLGVSGRLVALTHGGLEPVGSNRTPYGRALNRRVELEILR